MIQESTNLKGQEMKREIIILVCLLSIVLAGILLTTFFGMATIKIKEKVEPIKYEFKTPKDWFLDSTFTEKRHIYYETQSKMK